ncbi:MAG: hypothetical protein IJE08_15035 [Clostridia bacterium]|nr:hypothetical protein [Clostridia bacterium]
MKKPLYRSFAESFRLNIYMPETGLIAPPASTYRADGRLADVMSSEKPPQSVFFEIDDELNAVTGDGTRLDTLDAYLHIIRGKAVPVVYLRTKEAAAALAEYARENHLGDMTICVPYENRAILREARRLMPLSRGMLDVRGMELPELPELVGECSVSDAMMILSGNDISRETVRSLQKRFIQVWADDEGDLIPAVMSGACGVLTKEIEGFYNLLNRFPEGATLRPVPLYAHKSFHQTGEYPENSTAGCAAAGERGYDAAEIDVQLTEDDVMVVHHDRNTGKLFNENYVVHQTEWETLKTAERKAFPGYGLDRMDDLMTRMADYPETPVLIEIKTPADTFGVEEMVRQLKELLAREDVQKACTCIMGTMPPYLSYIHEELPFLPVARCCRVKEQEATDEIDENNLRIYQFAMDTRGANAGYNPYHPMISAIFTRLAHVRGITVFPWTWAFEPWEECGEAITRSYLQGHDGLTSDWVHKFKEVPVDVRAIYDGVCPADGKVKIRAEKLMRGAGWKDAGDDIELIRLEDGAAAAGGYDQCIRGGKRIGVGVWTELEDGSRVCVFGRECGSEII